MPCLTVKELQKMRSILLCAGQGSLIDPLLFHIIVFFINVTKMTNEKSPEPFSHKLFLINKIRFVLFYMIS